MAAEAFEGTITDLYLPKRDSRRRGLVPAEGGGGCRWPWVLRPAGRHTCMQLAGMNKRRTTLLGGRRAG
jgi:hypothetical protein